MNTRKRYGQILLLSSAALFATGCATTRSAGSRPDDMSAVKHRAVAAKHQREAKRHENRYDPNAESTRVHGPYGGGAAAGDVGEVLETTYNPTKVHLGHAAEHREHARQHAAAAATLEKFEAQSCQRFAKKTRVLCPLIGQVVRSEQIPGGVRLYLARGVPANAVLAHMRCHYAHGRSVGRQGMSACPLYLKDLQFKATSDGKSVEITSTDNTVVQAIRVRASAHVVVKR